MDKKAEKKLVKPGMLLAALAALAFIATGFSAAIIESDSYSMGDKVKIDLEGKGTYVMKVKTPETTLLKQGEDGVLLFRPEQTGDYEITLEYGDNKELYSFNVHGSENPGDTKQEITEILEPDDPNTAVASDSLRPFLTLSSQDSAVSFDDEPTFLVKASKESRTSLLGRVRNALSFSEEGTSISILLQEAVVRDSAGNLVNVSVDEKVNEEGLSISLERSREFKPGQYTISMKIASENGRQAVLTQTFLWGVMAINTDRSIYRTGEEAQFSMTVLDDKGRVVCDADIFLEINSPSGDKTILTPDEIIVSDECRKGGFTYEPDYSAKFVVQDPGQYLLNFSAETGRGTYSIQDTFDARDDAAFDIRRQGPTRLFPAYPYTMSISIEANEDFSGTIKETVPASFEITEQEGLFIERSGFEKILSWRAELDDGESLDLYYEFDPPDQSPQIFFLGPLEIGSFSETRQWQLANDVLFEGEFYLFHNGTNATDVPIGWSCASCNSSDPFFGSFVRGSDTFGDSGGSNTHSHVMDLVNVQDGAGISIDQQSQTSSAATHTHPALTTPTVSSQTNFPRYYSLQVIRYEGFGIPKVIPRNSIAIFNTTSLPDNWTRYTALDRRFVLANLTANLKGGSNNHTHTISAGLNAASGTVEAKNGGATTAIADDGHTHASNSSTSELADSRPPWHAVVFAQADINVTLPYESWASTGMIAMFNSTPPSGWSPYSESGDPLYRRFPMGNASYGGSGGSENHTHPDSSITSELPSASSQRRTGVIITGATGDHNHEITVNFTRNDSLPPYTDVIFAFAQEDFEPPNITLNDPQEGFSTSEPQVTFNSTISDNANIANVSLFGNFTGTYQRNLTNTSGLNDIDYLFTQTLPDGGFIWAVQACDLSNNCNITTNRTITIDSTPPTITITSPEETNISSDVVDFNISLDENGQAVWYTLDSGNTNISLSSPDALNWNGTNTSIGDSQYTVTFYANDSSGNIGNASRGFGIDTINPELSILEPQPINYTSTALNINFTVNDTNLDSCWYSDDSGVTNITLAGCSNTSYTANQGTTVLHLFANDSANNLNNTENVTFFVDSLNPLIEFQGETRPNGTAWEFDWIFANVSVTETNFANITFSLYNETNGLTLVNQTTYQSQIFHINWTGLNNNNLDYFYNVSITDTLGNTNATETRTLTLTPGDIQGPLITINSPAPEGVELNETSVLFNISLDEDGNSPLYSLDDFATNVSMSSTDNINWNATNSSIAPGNYTADFWAEDLAGNPSQSQRNFTVLHNSSLVMSFSQEPVEILEEFDVTANYTFVSNSSAVTGAQCVLEAQSFSKFVQGVGDIPTTDANGSEVFDIFGNNTLLVNITNIPIISNSTYDVISRLHRNNVTSDALRIYVNCAGNNVHNETYLVGEVNGSSGFLGSTFGESVIFFNSSFITTSTCSVIYESQNSTNVSGDVWHVANIDNTGLPDNVYSSNNSGQNYNPENKVGFVDLGYTLTDEADRTMTFNPSSQLYELTGIHHGGPGTFVDEVTCRATGVIDRTDNETLNVEDNTAPRVQITRLDPNPADFSVDEATVEWSVNDLQEQFKSINITYPNGSLLLETSNISFNLTVSQLSVEGDYNLTAFANDTTGNQGNDTAVLKVLRIFPLIFFTTGTEPDESNVTSDSVFANVSVTEDNLANITFRIHNSTAAVNVTTFQTETFSINWTGLPNGAYTYNVSVTDQGNNQNSTETRTIRLDTTGPLINSFSDSPDPVIRGQDINITANVTDNVIGIDSVQVEFNLTNHTLSFLTGDIYNNSINTSNLEFQTYTYVISASDTLGNPAATSSSTFKVVQELNAPLINSINDTPDPVSFGQNFNITANVTDDTNISEVWVEIDSANHSMSNSTGDLYNITFDSLDFGVGLFNYTVYANDTSGNINSSSGNITIQEGTFVATISVRTANPDPIDRDREGRYAVILFNPTSENLTVSDVHINASQAAGAVWSTIAQGSGNSYPTTGWTISNNRLVSWSGTYTLEAGRSAGFWITIDSNSVAETFPVDYSATINSTRFNDPHSHTATEFSSNNPFAQLALDMEGFPSFNTSIQGNTVKTFNISLEEPSNRGPIPSNVQLTITVPQGFTDIADAGGTGWGTATITDNIITVNTTQAVQNSRITYSFNASAPGGAEAQGLYILNAEMSGTNARAELESAIQVFDGDPPVISLSTPFDGQNISGFTITPFNYTVSDVSSLDSCSLYGNWSNGWHLNQTDNSASTDSVNNFSAIDVATDGFYIWNVECTDAFGNTDIAEANFTFGSFLFPNSPILLNVSQNETDGTGNISLFWNQTAHARGYEIYYNESLKGNFVFLAETSALNFTDTNFSGNQRRIYRVDAVNPIGQNSSSDYFGAHLYTLRHNGNTRNWLGLPSNASYLSRANDTLFNVRNATAFTKWNNTLQLRTTCNLFSCPDFPSCTDTNCNFRLSPGSGFEVNVNSSQPSPINWSMVGIVYPPLTLRLNKNATDFGKNWIGLYANTSLAGASGLLTNISTADAVSIWNASSQTSAGLIHNPFGPGFLGSNFSLTMERGYEVSVNASISWLQV